MVKSISEWKVKTLKKPDSLTVKINDIKQVVASAENYPAKRMSIIFSNTEYRLNDIPGINPSYISELKKITGDCIKLLETSQKESFASYNLRVGELLAKILNDAKPAFAQPEFSIN